MRGNSRRASTVGRDGFRDASATWQRQGAASGWLRVAGLASGRSGPKTEAEGGAAKPEVGEGREVYPDAVTIRREEPGSRDRRPLALYPYPSGGFH